MNTCVSEFANYYPFYLGLLIGLCLSISVKISHKSGGKKKPSKINAQHFVTNCLNVLNASKNHLVVMENVRKQAYLDTYNVVYAWDIAVRNLSNGRLIPNHDLATRSFHTGTVVKLGYTLSQDSDEIFWSPLEERKLQINCNPDNIRFMRDGNISYYDIYKDMPTGLIEDLTEFLNSAALETKEGYKNVLTGGTTND